MTSVRTKDGDSARRRLSWRACVESDDEENDDASTTTATGETFVDGKSRCEVVGRARRSRAVLGDVDVNAGRIIDLGPARGKSRANATTTRTTTRTTTTTSPRAYLAGSTPGVTSAKHASRVRALVINEDEDEDEDEEAEDADADAALRAFESGAWDAPAASGDDDTTDSTVVLTPGSGARDATRASRSVSETLAVFKSLARLAASPSEEEARTRRAAPTPANTPATTNEPAIVDLSVSPIIGVRRRGGEDAWNATMERIVDALDIRDEDDVETKTKRRSSRRYKMARASAVAVVMLRVAVRMVVVVTTSFATKTSSNDSLGRKCVVEGGAFALSWWFGAKVNWDSLSSTSYASYGGLMHAQKQALRLQRALQRDKAFRSALDVVGRASALFAYGSAFLGFLACVAKIAELIRVDASPSTKKLQKLSNAAAKHKKNVPSMNTPVGFILGKASASEETPTFRGATTFRAPADDSLSPLIV